MVFWCMSHIVYTAFFLLWYIWKEITLYIWFFFLPKDTDRAGTKFWTLKWINSLSNSLGFFEVST